MRIEDADMPDAVKNVQEKIFGAGRDLCQPASEIAKVKYGLILENSEDITTKGRDNQGDSFLEGSRAEQYQRRFLAGLQ